MREEMKMVRIEAGTEAWHQLVSMAASGRDISIDVRKDGIAFKLGEGMWTPTLRTNFD